MDIARGLNNRKEIYHDVSRLYNLLYIKFLKQYVTDISLIPASPLYVRNMPLKSASPSRAGPQY